jgi:S-DNA-T family DNA segregation ATPase FtsK/SpoIIIE
MPPKSPFTKSATEDVILQSEEGRIGTALVLKLQGLGIRATISKVEVGPIVSGFYFKMHNTVPLTKIMGRAEDFALAVGSDACNIQRIKDEVVIFVANKERSYVDFKDTLNYIMTDEETSKAIIPIPLGVDHTGKHAFIDLVNCPHILLAGSTGSGKSVFEAAILASLSIRKNMHQLQIYTVDTKQLDLPLFSSIPLIQNTITDLMSYLQLMTMLLKEHEQRALKLRNASLRSLREYNTLVGEDNAIPYILLMIDEFADLIGQDQTARKDKTSDINDFPKADFLLQRLAQVGRATGIHIIAATQRTSVKVINGDIKANFPCRISLRLPTEADSRTILGTQGAENLLGKGDMLVQTPDSEVIRRYHGPYVKHDDILQVVTNWKEIKEMYKQISIAKEVKCLNN